MISGSPNDANPIARQIAVGFGTTATVAIGMCLLLLIIIHQVSGLVAGMRDDEESIRRGVELANAVRELSADSAHALVAPDEALRRRQVAARYQVQRVLDEIATRIPESERYRIELLAGQLSQMQRQLALSTPDGDNLLAYPQVRARASSEVARLGREAAAQADALARLTTSSMAHAHVLAIDATELGLWGGGVCAALVVALSIGFTWRLRAAVLKPLIVLAAAAERVGRGDFHIRVGNVGQGELLALGEAFDRMAEELAHREARLLHHERMAAIGQLAAGVAHELNNPIGIIRGYLKTMTPDAEPETLREELTILDEEAGHCQRIAEDLLSYARAGELSLELVAIEPFLEDTVRRVGDSVAGEGRSIVVQVEPAVVELDRGRMRQVVHNLLANACQASEQGQSVVLRGRTGPANSSYLIEVEDAGPGIPLAERERVFEPFFTTRRDGSGLGLAVCVGIAKAHRGCIIVTNGSAGGALLRVELPLRQSAALGTGIVGGLS